MIRAVSFFHKIKSSSSDEILFQSTIRSLHLSRPECPACGAVGGFRKISPYRRMMISVHDGRRHEQEVSVPMCRCSSCGHAHAILPDVLIPFSSYTLRFILTVLQKYLEHEVPVRSLCDTWQISVSTLYEWIHMFASQFSAWKGILHRIEWVCSEAVDTILNAPAFPSSFSSLFGFSFLQCHAATCSAPVAPASGGS